MALVADVLHTCTSVTHSKSPFLFLLGLEQFNRATDRHTNPWRRRGLLLPVSADPVGAALYLGVA
jgi:hypothetical protein